MATPLARYHTAIGRLSASSTTRILAGASRGQVTSSDLAAVSLGARLIALSFMRQMHPGTQPHYDDFFNNDGNTFLGQLPESMITSYSGDHDGLHGIVREIIRLTLHQVVNDEHAAMPERKKKYWFISPQPGACAFCIRNSGKLITKPDYKGHTSCNCLVVPLTKATYAEFKVQQHYVDKIYYDAVDRADANGTTDLQEIRKELGVK